jgi:hypothetical protein
MQLIEFCNAVVYRYIFGHVVEHFGSVFVGNGTKPLFLSKVVIAIGHAVKDGGELQVMCRMFHSSTKELQNSGCLR